MRDDIQIRRARGERQGRMGIIGHSSPFHAVRRARSVIPRPISFTPRAEWPLRRA